MRPGYLIAFSCAVLAASTAAGHAADYDPPIFVEEAPEFVPVEIGSGWYLRGDVGYNVGKPRYDFTLLGEEVSHKRFTGSIGAGYHLSDALRLDITASYLGKDSIELSDGFNSGSGSHTMWSGMLNGYYDIATIRGFTPYIGAGVGFTYSRHKVDIEAPDYGITGVHWSDREYNFAYALMAGASLQITDNVSVDAGYQFLHTPKMTYWDVDTLTPREGSQKHLVKVGLRYDLW